MRSIKFNMLCGEDYQYLKKDHNSIHINLLGISPLEVPVNELQEVFNDQYIFSPALTEGRKDIDFISADLIFIDFDNKEFEEGKAPMYSIEDFKNDAKNKYKLRWSIIYKSMSYTDKCHKFRVGFIINKTVNKREDYKIMLDSLQVIFSGKMDSKSRNVSRFYYPKKTDTKVIINSDEYYKKTVSKESIEKALNNAVRESISTLQDRNYIDLYLKDSVYKYMPYRKYDIKENKFENEWYSPSLLKDYCITGDIFQKINTNSEYIKDGKYKSPNYRINKSDLTGNCQLMKEFSSGNYEGIEKGGHYASLLKIGTTLSIVRFKNSKSNNKTIYGELEYITKITNKYGQISNSNTDSNTKRKVKEWLSTKDIVSCDGYFSCPYKDKCNTFNTFGGLTQMIKSNCEESYEYDLCPDGISKDEARDKFKSDFINALGSDIKYHNFTAPTGIGKTHTIVNNVKPKEDEVFIILAPTHKLIQEEYSSFPHTKENIELPFKCRFYPILGYKGKELNKEEKDKLKAYDKVSRDNNNILTSNPIVVTTHKMFALKGEEVIEKLRKQKLKVTIIIDEDITGEFIYTDSIYTSEFKTNIDNLIKDLEFYKGILRMAAKDIHTKKDIEDRTKKIIKKLKKIKKSEEFYNNFKFSNFEKETITNTLKSVNNIEDYSFEFISHIIKDELSFFKHSYNKKNNICFINNKELPLDAKYIFLSATPNIVGLDILTQCYLRINYNNYKIKTDIKVSQINQNTSNNKLKEGINEVLIKKAKELIVNPDNTLLITFKDKHEEIRNLLGLKHSLYLGNVKGYNEFKGMDVIVIGTPYPSPKKIKLFGILKGFTSELDYEMSNDGQVTLGPNNYKIMSYNKPFLNYLQLEFMAQELYQSVGRSRYLDNEVNISVLGRVPVKEITQGYAIINNSSSITLNFFI